MIDPVGYDPGSAANSSGYRGVMTTETPNALLHGGPGDGEAAYVARPDGTLSYEDVGGGSVTYVATDRTEERDGIALRVYEPK